MAICAPDGEHATHDARKPASTCATTLPGATTNRLFSVTATTKPSSPRAHMPHALPSSWTVADPLYAPDWRFENRTVRSRAADARMSPGKKATSTMPFSWPVPSITWQPPVRASHTARTPSNEADAKRALSVVRSTLSAVIARLWPISEETTLPAAGSIRLMRPESESDATVAPCQQQPTCMSPTVPCSAMTIVQCGWPRSTCHTLAVLSADTVSSCFESGAHAHA
mmetsp:Transcript_1572/g.5178  ORF Transcript_1572/g.5178 Transcript_1572/m.5178 type:complete len:226 (-) Transcript_1572:746-1423(-)